MKKIILALFLTVFSCPVSAFAAEVNYDSDSLILAPTVDDFTDLKSADFGFEYVDYLRGEGILSGYEDGSFRPDAKINRAEFLKIAVGAAKANGLLDGEVEGANCYKDVKDQWFAPYICKAAKLKYVAGYKDGYFRPDQNINFAEASKIIDNILHLPVDTSLYTDSWFHPYIIPLQNRNAIPFSILSFNQEISRIEMAEIISSAIKNGSQDVPYGPKHVTYIDLKILTDWTDAKRLITHLGEEGDFFEHDGDVYSVEFGKAYPVPDADATTFEFLEGNFYRDKNAFYRISNTANGVDRYTDFSGDFDYWISFNPALATDSNIGFIADDENVYLAGYSDIEKIEGADVGTFSIAPCGYNTCGFDKNNFYYFSYSQVKSISIDGSTFASYSLIDESEYYWGDRTYAPFAVDDKNVYSFIEDPPSVIEGLDPFTAQVYFAPTYAEFYGLNVSPYILFDKDKVIVFLISRDEWLEIPGIDPATFEIVINENKEILFKDAKQSFKLNKQTDVFELVK